MTWSAPSDRTISTFLVLHTRSDFSRERFGDLHGKGPHATRGAIDQDVLPGLDLPVIA